MQTHDRNPTPYWRKSNSFHFSIGLILSLTLVTTAFEWNFRNDLTDRPIRATDIDGPIWVMDPTEVPEVPRPKIPTKPIINPDPLEAVNTDPIDPVEPIVDLPEPPANLLDDLLAGEAPVENTRDEAVYELIPAHPKGGMETFYNYLYKNIRYPDHLKNQNMTGKVFVAFEINEKGEIDKVKIVKGFDTELEKEIIRILKSAPAWIPAQKGNEKVRMIHQIPFTFDIR